MAKLPENYIQVLTYLRERQPNGMTTNQILEQAKKNRYFEFNNSTKVSSVIFYMRAKKLLTSIDQPGGRIHHITAYGMSQLEDEIGHAAPAAAFRAKYDELISMEAKIGHVASAPITLPTDAIDEIIQDIQNIQDGPDETQAAEQPAPELPETSPQKARDLLAEFDEHIQIVRSALVDELAEIKIQRIENKHLKLAVLEKLEPMVNSEISGVIAAIRNDLEQMGDSHG